ncbi:ankyrin repeat-containing domain protein [Aspergillus karnatakaensis]|uniref:ankyrin repeat-containing domain protein n=1 Tax=Aspergillus karnatakaensis TaxID=1810916 RepID=UPI003CCD29DA
MFFPRKLLRLQSTSPTTIPGEHQAMSLHSLPPEVLLEIVKSLDSLPDIYHLCCSSRYLHNISVNHLYSVDAKHNGSSALIYAAYKGEENTAQRSISLTTDLNSVGYSCPPRWNGNWPSSMRLTECRPLFIAATHGYTKIIKLLLKSGIDINAKDRQGRTALVLALENGMPGTVRMLLGEAQVSLSTKTAKCALYAACNRGHKKMVRLILKHGGHRVDVNTRAGPTSSKPTALTIASQKNYRSMVQALVDAGADVNASKYETRSALQCAAANGNVGIMKILLESGADVNRRSEYSGPAQLLLAAASAGSTKGVQMILEHGVISTPRAMTHWFPTRFLEQYSPSRNERLIYFSNKALTLSPRPDNLAMCYKRLPTWDIYPV